VFERIRRLVPYHNEPGYTSESYTTPFTSERYVHRAIGIIHGVLCSRICTVVSVPSSLLTLSQPHISRYLEVLNYSASNLPKHLLHQTKHIQRHTLTYRNSRSDLTTKTPTNATANMVATSNGNAAQTVAHPGGPASKKRKFAPSLPTPPASPAEWSDQRDRLAKRATHEAITATTYVKLNEDEEEQKMKQEREEEQKQEEEDVESEEESEEESTPEEEESSEDEASEPEDNEEDIIVPSNPQPRPQTGFYKMGALPEYRRAGFAWQKQQKRGEERKERHTALQWRRHERFLEWRREKEPALKVEMAMLEADLARRAADKAKQQADWDERVARDRARIDERLQKALRWHDEWWPVYMNFMAKWEAQRDALILRGRQVCVRQENLPLLRATCWDVLAEKEVEAARRKKEELEEMITRKARWFPKKE
jgi:hypothetical protein